MHDEAHNESRWIRNSNLEQKYDAAQSQLNCIDRLFDKTDTNAHLVAVDQKEQNFNGSEQMFVLRAISKWHENRYRYSVVSTKWNSRP